jgi:hypothetical protein
MRKTNYTARPRSFLFFFSNCLVAATGGPLGKANLTSSGVPSAAGDPASQLPCPRQAVARTTAKSPVLIAPLVAVAIHAFDRTGSFDAPAASLWARRPGLFQMSLLVFVER